MGALLIALAEQYGVAYAPTYGVVFQFLILVLALAFRPQGILGARGARAREASAMSAAAWRKAMNTGAAAHAWSAPARPRALPAAVDRAGRARRGALASIRPRHVIVLAALLVYPWVASPFFTFQIAAQSLVLGLDRALAHVPRGLRRHGLALADDRSRASPATRSRSSA